MFQTTNQINSHPATQNSHPFTSQARGFQHLRVAVRQRGDCPPPRRIWSLWWPWSKNLSVMGEGWIMMDVPMGFTNNVLLVKIEGAVWYTIYHHLPVVKGSLQTPLLINQKKEKDIYAEFTYSSTWFCQPKTHRLRDSQLTEGSIDTNQRDPVNIPHL